MTPETSNAFCDIMFEKLTQYKINDDPPDFFGKDCSVMDFEDARFTVLEILPTGILCSDQEKETIYLDFVENDICNKEDVEFEDEELDVGTKVTTYGSFAVFMSDEAYETVKNEYLLKIRVLNEIYKSVNFPLEIKLIE